MTQANRFAPGIFTPAPERGGLARMVLTQARTETTLALRHGEQVLITLLIPIALLIGLTLTHFVPLPSPRINAVTPRIFALAIMSSAFTGQAIALGFDRRYGVLKRLAATALPSPMVVAGRMIAALCVMVVQLVILGIIAAILGWSPTPAGALGAIVLVVLGTLAFGALGVLLGGSLRAEIVLAVANLVWFVLLFVGGIALPSASMPGVSKIIVELLPSGALAEGLNTALMNGSAFPWHYMLILAVWAAVAGAIATRTTKLT
ncbi:MAG: ABC transporter permease [Sciscionella sp.]